MEQQKDEKGKENDGKLYRYFFFDEFLKYLS